MFASNNLASQSLVLRGNASRASIILEPKPMPFVSTIPTYYMVFPAIPSKYFMCYLLFKIYYPLFVSMFISS